MFPKTSVTYNPHPDAIPAEEKVQCALCAVTILKSEATIGLPYRDGSPAFACTLHLQDMRLWLIKWARFAASQHGTD